MRFEATEFEFRHRVWFLTGIFWLGFSCYSVDHSNVSFALARFLAGRRTNGAPSHLDPYIRCFFALGTLIVLLAALIRTWAAAYMHSSVIHSGALHSDRLVASGPYRHSRNPLYLGTILVALGMSVMASRVGFFVMVAGITLFSCRLILREEAALSISQGENYRLYCAAVARLIPSWRPRVPRGPARPNWPDAFASETPQWGFTASAAVFAVTERPLYLWIVLGCTFAIYFAQGFRRRAKALA